MIFFCVKKRVFYTFSVIFPCNLFESNVKFSVIFQLSCPCNITAPVPAVHAQVSIRLLLTWSSLNLFSYHWKRMNRSTCCVHMKWVSLKVLAESTTATTVCYGKLTTICILLLRFTNTKNFI